MPQRSKVKAWPWLLNGLSDNNEDETPSKTKRKVILPDPHTPIAPATRKMTAAQKQVQENTIVAWKKAEEEAKTAAKVAEKVANEEKKEAKQKEKEAAKKVRADEKAIKEAKKEADRAKKKADKMKKVAEKVKKEVDKVKKEVDKAKKEADKITKNQKENSGLSKAGEDSEEGVKSRNAVQTSTVVNPTIEEGSTDPLVVGRKVKGRKALLSDSRALKGGAASMSKVTNCDPNVNAELVIIYHSSCNLGKT